MNKKKKGAENSKKQKTAHDRNKNHQASLPDGWDILPNVVRHSGLFEAFAVAKEIDLKGRTGLEALNKMMSYHQETFPGGVIKWVPGPASWMVKAISSADKKDHAKFFEFFGSLHDLQNKWADEKAIFEAGVTE